MQAIIYPVQEFQFDFLYASSSNLGMLQSTWSASD